MKEIEAKDFPSCLAPKGTNFKFGAESVTWVLDVRINVRLCWRRNMHPLKYLLPGDQCLLLACTIVPCRYVHLVYAQVAAGRSELQQPS